jgi:hypothetical protein
MELLKGAKMECEVISPFSCKIGLSNHPRIAPEQIDQSGTGSEEDSWIIPSRFDHRLATFFGPDLGEVTKEASRERLDEYQRGHRSNYPIGLVSIGSAC